MSTEQTPEEMKAFVRQHFEDFVNNQNAAVIHQNMTPDFTDHDGPGGKPTDADGDEKMMQAMYARMPGLRVTVEDMVAEGDKVMCRNVWRWADPGTGKPMEFHGFVLWRLEGGEIAERWATVTPPAEVPATQEQKPVQDDILAVARQFMEAGIGSGDLSAFDAALAPDIVVETGLSPAGPIVGLAAYKEVFAAFSDAWPVKKFVIDEIFGSGEKVVVRFTATAVFRKDYYGLKATQQVIEMKEVHVLTFQDGKVIQNIVSGTNFPFEYLMYPVLKDLVIGSLPLDGA